MYYTSLYTTHMHRVTVYTDKGYTLTPITASTGEVHYVRFEQESTGRFINISLEQLGELRSMLDAFLEDTCHK